MIDFYAALNIPDACYLGKRIFKKLVYDHTKLNATDKKAFADDVDGIEWKYTLKPSTINIPRYEDEDHEYLEVAIIDVILKAPHRHKRIAKIIQRAIPYPAMIVFRYDISIALNLALKRINRADQNKIMVKAFHDTHWMNLDSPSDQETDFFKSLDINNFAFNHFYDWYADLLQRVVALNCARISGNYTMESHKTDVDRVEELREIYDLEQQQNRLRSDLKKQIQFSRKVDLNMQIKKITEQIDYHKSRI
ncbi:DUF4391 domain-containing protein [Desulfobacula phenolica]|uniref:DUF4391 domain-containing protein n=1 Tax=Desulfobacula phenolica TaxID=90732 RepID=A0A1H2JG41_9BACT|nr:DUF4391 domain-containing protein [Desulfobacula phenolica]SDU55327.1 protein of unknown function [Desulfobacula phenolica]